MVKNLPANSGDVGLIPGSGRFPGKGNGNPLLYFHSWEIPWTEEPGSAWGLKRVRHDLAANQKQRAAPGVHANGFFNPAAWVWGTREPSPWLASQGAPVEQRAGPCAVTWVPATQPGAGHWLAVTLRGRQGGRRERGSQMKPLARCRDNDERDSDKRSTRCSNLPPAPRNKAAWASKPRAHAGNVHLHTGLCASESPVPPLTSNQNPWGQISFRIQILLQTLQRHHAA